MFGNYVGCTNAEYGNYVGSTNLPMQKLCKIKNYYPNLKHLERNVAIATNFPILLYAETTSDMSRKSACMYLGFKYRKVNSLIL